MLSMPESETGLPDRAVINMNERLPGGEHWAVRLRRILDSYHQAPMGIAIAVGAIVELSRGLIQ